LALNFERYNFADGVYAQTAKLLHTKLKLEAFYMPDIYIGQKKNRLSATSNTVSIHISDCV